MVSRKRFMAFVAPLYPRGEDDLRCVRLWGSWTCFDHTRCSVSGLRSFRLKSSSDLPKATKANARTRLGIGFYLQGLGFHAVAIARFLRF